VPTSKTVTYEGAEYQTIDPESPLDPRIDPSHFKSVDEAQAWITRRRNWHDSGLFVVKWDVPGGPTFRRQEGRYIAEHPYDTGLAETVLWRQRQRRRGHTELDPVQPTGSEER
jgi:hypothetical protein